MLTLKEIAAADPATLFEFLYADGIAWGVGTPAEAVELASFSGEPVEDLRYRILSQ